MNHDSRWLSPLVYHLLALTAATYKEFYLCCCRSAVLCGYIHNLGQLGQHIFNTFFCKLCEQCFGFLILSPSRGSDHIIEHCMRTTGRSLHGVHDNEPHLSQMPLEVRLGITKISHTNALVKIFGVIFFFKPELDSFIKMLPKTSK